LGIAAPGAREEPSRNCGAFDYVFDRYIEVTLACGTEYIEALVDCVKFELRKSFGTLLRFVFNL
jgi:hypothetical protein